MMKELKSSIMDVAKAIDVNVREIDAFAEEIFDM